jgi:RNA ligase (TIGR02306 family)
MRKLASVRKIDEIRPIEGADAIEAAVVGGWVVVAKKSEFTAGDLAVYLEIDSFVPTELAPFLTKPGHFPKEFNGVKGERLRTVKLRGQVSQGL